jgi:hypothetical protein
MDDGYGRMDRLGLLHRIQLLLGIFQQHGVPLMVRVIQEEVTFAFPIFGV